MYCLTAGFVRICQKKKIMKKIYACLLLTVIYSSLYAHMVQQNWKVGDKVLVQDMYNNYKWEDATITIVHADWNPVQYVAELDDPAGHAITRLLLRADQVRGKNVVAAKFELNARVDVYYADGGPKARGTVIAVLAGNRYKIRYDGCANYWDEEVDWSQVKPQAMLSSADPDIQAVMGKWAMFVYSYPNTYTDGKNVYRVYGTGAKAPPLQINGDGTYVWYDEFNKPPVKGRWITHAAMNPRPAMGTENYNGILIKDSKGIYWKIHRDRAGHIEARKMCSGETQGGSRL